MPASYWASLFEGRTYVTNTEFICIICALREQWAFLLYERPTISSKNTFPLIDKNQCFPTETKIFYIYLLGRISVHCNYKPWQYKTEIMAKLYTRDGGTLDRLTKRNVLAIFDSAQSILVNYLFAISELVVVRLPLHCTKVFKNAIIQSSQEFSYFMPKQSHCHINERRGWTILSLSIHNGR